MSFLPTCLLAIHKLVETQLRYEVSMPGCSCSLILQCAKVIPDAMQWVRRQCKAATMKSAFFFWFCCCFTVQCNAYEDFVAAHEVLFFAPTIMLCVICFLTSKQTKRTGLFIFYIGKLSTSVKWRGTKGALHQY